jgi:hypothetical protein
MPTRQEVHEFLRSFKLAIDFDRCRFRDRTRTEQDLVDLNLTRRQAMELICELTPDHYCKGPEPDDTDGLEGGLGLRLRPRGH